MLLVTEKFNFSATSVTFSKKSFLFMIDCYLGCCYVSFNTVKVSIIIGLNK
jgi:hypothetical protein